MDNIVDRFRKRRADRLAVAAYKKRRDERLKRYDAEEEKPERQEDPKNNGNTRLPFGLCKKNGIDLPQGATPHDAWQALKGEGITPPWEGGESGEKAKEQLPNYKEGESSKESTAQPKNGIKTPTEGTEDLESEFESKLKTTKSEEEKETFLTEAPVGTVICGKDSFGVNGWKKTEKGWESLDGDVTLEASDVAYHLTETYKPSQWWVDKIGAEGVAEEVEAGKGFDYEKYNETLKEIDHLSAEDGINAMKNAPIGTVLKNKNYTFTKTGENTWTSEDGKIHDDVDMAFGASNMANVGMPFEASQGEEAETVEEPLYEYSYEELIGKLQSLPIGTELESDKNGMKETYKKITDNKWQYKNEKGKSFVDGTGEVADYVITQKFKQVEGTGSKTGFTALSAGEVKLEAVLEKGGDAPLSEIKNALEEAPEGMKIVSGNVNLGEVTKQNNGEWKTASGAMLDGEMMADWIELFAKKNPSWQFKPASSVSKVTTDIKQAVADLNKQIDDAYKSLADYNPAFVENILKQMPDGAVVEKKTAWGKETYTKKNGMFVNNISKSVKNLSSALATLQGGNKIELYDKIPLDKKTLTSATKQAYKTEDAAQIESHLKDALGFVDNGEEIFANGYKWKKDGDDFVNQSTGEAVTKDDLAKNVANVNGYVDFEEKYGSFGDGKGTPAKGSIAGLKPTKNPFSKSAYSEDRKNNAAWCNGLAQMKDLHSKSMKGTKEWIDAVGEEGKNLLWDYTSGSGNINSSLRTKDGSPDGSHYPSEKNYQDAIKLKKAIGKSHLQEDMWLQRGVKEGVGLYNFGIPQGFFNKAMNGSPSEIEANLKKLFVGKKGHDAAFMSCGSGKGAGFDGRFIYNIYAPKGTSAVYAEPLSAFGHTEGGGHNWNGKYGEYNGSTSSELETLINAGTSFKCTGVSYKNGQIYLDVEVIGQDDPEAEPSFPHVKKT